ncbi:MAG: prolyl oligopeptidase family serine peptidase [Spirochaetes bacterium]|nr:prolyl oligopeptidase family serine peptidase [Spirochaetota bacterium]
MREAVTAKLSSWQKSGWHGRDRYDGLIAGRSAVIVVPPGGNDNRWAWRPEFFDAFPNADVGIVERGMYLAFIAMNDHYGSPKGLMLGEHLYRFMTETLSLSATPAVIGLSRGGLTAYNWAVQYPERVSCIYVDAPVCDFKSWPGGKGKGPGSFADWQKLMAVYGFKNEAEAIAYRGNPVDNAETIARAKIPVLHVAGDADETVPIDENTHEMVRRLREAGGNVEVIVKPGVKHHPHGLDDPKPIVDFVLKNSR